MSDHERADILNRTLTMQHLAKIEQQHLPPVDASNAQEFARLMQRPPQGRHEVPAKETAQRTLSWDRFKQSAFRFADRILAPETATRGAGRRLDGGIFWKDLPDGAPRRQHVEDADETAPLTGRGLLMRLGASLFRDRPASDLSHDLAECVRLADGFGKNWQLEIQLANDHLPGTRLHLRCDDSGLHLRFVCADARSAAVLRNNRMLLLTRMGAVTPRLVCVEIDESGVPVEAGGTAREAGGKA